MRTFIEEAMALVSIILFLATVYVWGQIIENRVIITRQAAAAEKIERAQTSRALIRLRGVD